MTNVTGEARGGKEQCGRAAGTSLLLAELSRKRREQRLIKAHVIIQIGKARQRATATILRSLQAKPRASLSSRTLDWSFPIVTWRAMIAPALHSRTDHLIETSGINRFEQLIICLHRHYVFSARYHTLSSLGLVQSPRPLTGNNILLAYFDSNAPTSIQFMRPPETSVGHDVASQSSVTSAIADSELLYKVLFRQ